MKQKHSMKQTCWAIALMLTVACTNYATAGLGEPVAVLEQSELFRTLGLVKSQFTQDEIDVMGGEEVVASANVVVYRPADSINQSLFSVIVFVDSAGTVRALNLLLASSFVRDRGERYRYAGRVTRQFFQSALTEQELKSFTLFLNQIEYPRHLPLPVGMTERPPIPDSPTADYITYLGMQQIYVKTYGKVSLVIEQADNGKTPSISVRLERLR